MRSQSRCVYGFISIDMKLPLEKIVAFFFLLNLTGRSSADHVNVVRTRRQNWPINADMHDGGPFKARLLANLNRYSSADALSSPMLGSGPDTLSSLAGGEDANGGVAFNSFQQNIDATSPGEYNNILQPLSLQQHHFDDNFWRERPTFQSLISGNDNHGNDVAVTPPNLFGSLFFPPTTIGGVALAPTPLVHFSPLVGAVKNPPQPGLTHSLTFTVAPPPTAVTPNPIFGQFFATIVTTTVAPIFLRSATVTFPPITTTLLSPRPQFSKAQFSDEPQQRQIDEYEQALGVNTYQGGGGDTTNKGGNVDDGVNLNRLNFDPKNNFHQRPYPNNIPRSDLNNYGINAFISSEEGRGENFISPTAPLSITLRPPTLPPPAASPSTGSAQGNENPIFQIEGDGGGGGNIGEDGGTNDDIRGATQITMPVRPTYVNHTAYFAGISPLPTPPLLSTNNGGHYRMIIKGHANGRYYNNPATVNGHQSSSVAEHGASRNFNVKLGDAENRKSNRNPSFHESPSKNETGKARTPRPIPIHAFSRVLDGSGDRATASEAAIVPQRVDVRRELESRLGSLLGTSTTPPSPRTTRSAGGSNSNNDKPNNRKTKPVKYFDSTSNRILQQPVSDDPPLSSGRFVADQREYSVPSKPSSGYGADGQHFDGIYGEGGKYRDRQQLSASSQAYFQLQPLAAPTFSRPNNPLFHLPPGLDGVTPPLLLSEFAAPPPRVGDGVRSSTNSPEQYVRELENLDDDYMQNIVGDEPPRMVVPNPCGSADVKCQQNSNNINYRRPQLLAFEGVESPQVRTLNRFNSIVSEEENTDMCNSHRLRTIIKEAVIAGDAEASKRAIQRRAETELSGSLSGGGFYNVICGTGFFSYIAHTDEFCLVAAGGLNCYAFSPVCGTRLSFAAGIARRRRADTDDGGINEGTTRSSTKASRRLAAINDVDARLRRKNKIIPSSASDGVMRPDLEEKRKAFKVRLQRYFAEKRRRKHL